MPIGGWKGLTYDDDSQAVAICQVMKKFTDQGLEVWLVSDSKGTRRAQRLLIPSLPLLPLLPQRFAHEINWYQRAFFFLLLLRASN